MLTIRMQRRGRTGHAQFRVVVQDSRFSPTSGRVVAYVGNYDPHTKVATLDGEKISGYLANGAQPSDRVAKLLTKEGIKVPDWFKPAAPKKKEVRNPDKRRSTRPEGAPAPEPKAEATEEPPTEEPVIAEPAGETVPAEAESPAEPEAPKELPAETVAEEPVPAEETPAEVPAEAKPAQ